MSCENLDHIIRRNLHRYPHVTGIVEARPFFLTTSVPCSRKYHLQIIVLISFWWRHHWKPFKDLPLAGIIETLTNLRWSLPCRVHKNFIRKLLTENYAAIILHVSSLKKKRNLKSCISVLFLILPKLTHQLSLIPSALMLRDTRHLKTVYQRPVPHIINSTHCHPNIAKVCVSLAAHKLQLPRLNGAMRWHYLRLHLKIYKLLGFHLLIFLPFVNACGFIYLF